MQASLVHPGRPRFDIGDIVRQHRAALEAEQALTIAQRRALSAIELCRTAALGGHVDVCLSCGFEHHHYHSCRNRHCPKCQWLAQERWIQARSQRLLPVRHFHVVFTLPSELRALARFQPRRVFGALFSAAGATLLELGRSRLDALLGASMVLHTWTRDLRFHPHVHAIVTAGGLALDGSRWKPSSTKYLFPVKVMGLLLRGKMLDALRSLQRDGVFNGFHDFCDPEAFERLMARLARTTWVVYAKKPFRRVDHVLAYLGRYTHRVAISNSRIVNVTEREVIFRTKNGKTVTLSPLCFLQRFIQHVLPDRFQKIRHFGLYAGTHARSGGKLHRARQLFGTIVDTTCSIATEATIARWLDELLAQLKRCPRCGEHLMRVGVPSSRAPPRMWAA